MPSFPIFRRSSRSQQNRPENDFAQLPGEQSPHQDATDDKEQPELRTSKRGMLHDLLRRTRSRAGSRLWPGSGSDVSGDHAAGSIPSPPGHDSGGSRDVAESTLGGTLPPSQKQAVSTQDHAQFLRSSTKSTVSQLSTFRLHHTPTTSVQRMLCSRISLGPASHPRVSMPPSPIISIT